MRIGTWNILSGQRPGPGPMPDVAAEVAALDLDVIGLNEVDANWSRSGLVHQARAVAEAMRAGDWRFAPSFRGPDHDRVSARGMLAGPHDAIIGEHYGIALVSRIPVTRWQRIELGRSRVGFPLLHARDGRRQWRYVADEPHIAIIAELANGWTVIATHLSFMTPTAVEQLARLRGLARHLGDRVAIIGDMNLARLLIPLRPRWHSVVNQSTYPSWRPGVQFDHILLPRSVSATPLQLPASAMSDHLPIAVDVG